MSDKTKVLVIVDVQNDFVDGALGSPEAEKIIPALVEKIRNFDGDIFVTMDTHGENYLDTFEGERLPIPHCIRKTDGWRLYPAVKEALKGKDVAYCYKNTFGASTLGDDIVYFGAATCVPDIEIVGLCTDICVIANALLLRTYFPNSKITVDSACCAGTTVEKHKAALDVMRSCQIDVI